MMVLKNKWKNRFILILFMVGFVFFACKEETDLDFNGDITVIKSFDNDTLLSPVKVELEDIYDGSVVHKSYCCQCSFPETVPLRHLTERHQEVLWHSKIEFGFFH